jgi:hypothetical protein
MVSYFGQFQLEKCWRNHLPDDPVDVLEQLTGLVEVCGVPGVEKGEG